MARKELQRFSPFLPFWGKRGRGGGGSWGVMGGGRLGWEAGVGE